MKRWAVGYYNQHNNILTIEIVNALTWWEAVYHHSQVGKIKFDIENLNSAKEAFFNCDAGLDVVEIVN